MSDKIIDYCEVVLKLDPVNHYYLFTKEDLKTIKNKITLSELIDLENKLDIINMDFEKENLGVTFKPSPIEGIDIKDYVSLATYWWPNPNTLDHLPYIRHDGNTNPEGDLYDKPKLRRLSYNIYYLCLMYYLTQNKKYYDLLKKNIKYYFLDSITGMNPNINHGQMLRGVDLGRQTGIIDFSANFSYSLWMLKQIYDLGLVEEDFKLEFDSWLKQLLNWLKTSKLGNEEKNQKNNHGIFYDFGNAMIAYFINEKDEVLEIAPRLIKRMNTQISCDGKMEEELARTKSKSYSLMAFKGICDYSVILEEVSGKNLWNKALWSNQDNIDLKVGASFLFERLVTKEKSWDYQQIVTFDEATVAPLIASCTKYLGYEYAMFNKLEKNTIIDEPLFTILSKIA